MRMARCCQKCAILPEERRVIKNAIHERETVRRTPLEHAKGTVLSKGRLQPCKRLVGAFSSLWGHNSGLWVHMPPQRDIKLGTPLHTGVNCHFRLVKKNKFHQKKNKITNCFLPPDVLPHTARGARHPIHATWKTIFATPTQLFP